MRLARMIPVVFLTIVTTTMLTATTTTARETMMNTTRKIADAPEKISPIQVGQSLPPLSLKDLDSKEFDLNEAIARKPAVLIFYRGGWCPYCNLQLAGLQKIEAQLLESGFQMIAVSPDRPEKLKESVDKHQLTYRLLSDNAMTASTALGIAFHLDDALVTKYKDEYKIDLEGDSGHTHHLLPVPAVFIVGQDGVIHFSYVNPDYKVRLDANELLKAAREYQKTVR